MVVVASLIALLLTPQPASAKPQAADLFNQTSVSKITIRLSDKEAAKLVGEPKTSVSARFDISNSSVDHGFQFKNLPINFHLKGTSTLRQNPSLVSNRPSLRVKFKPDGLMKLGFLGSLKSLTLNSMTQDVSKIHEYSSYQLFNAVGVPAPRVAYAQVKVVIGDRVYQKGLFAIIEPYDDVFLKNRFPNQTGHLYEPCGHWTDITRGGATKGGETCTSSLFEVKEGWKKTPNKKDLKALVSVQKIKSNKAWWQAMDRYTERDKFLAMWAVENFTSAWDSYSGAVINNYYLRSDRMGVFTMMPTGADESFAYNFKMDALSTGYPLIYDNFQIQSKNRGSMFNRCLRYQPCFNAYLDQLKIVRDTAKEINLVGKMKAIAKVIKAPSIWAVQSTQNWVGMKSREVDALLKKYGR